MARREAGEQRDPSQGFLLSLCQRVGLLASDPVDGSAYSGGRSDVEAAEDVTGSR
jgi:hypothetical protein